MEDDENKLFVGALPLDVTEDDLRSVFSTYGAVSKIVMLDKKAADELVKAAFVFYSARSSGDDAIKVLNGVYKIRDHSTTPIRVSWAKSKGGKGGKGAPQDFETTDGFKLFVGNLPGDCQQGEIQSVFGTYGEVTKIHLMEPSSASGQRCALVFYRTQKSGEDAIQVLHQQYKIRADAPEPIMVKWGGNKDKGKGKDSGKGDGKGKGKDKGWDGGGGWQGGGGGGGGGWQGQGQDNSWQGGPPQNSWQGGDSWQGGKGNQGGDSWGGGQGGNNWNAPSWSGADGGGGNWGQGYGNDKGGKGGGDKGYGKADKGGGKGGCKDSGKPDAGGKRLFIGNLPADVGKDNVEYVFKTYGQVENIHILDKKPSPNGSVAGFVEYSTPEEAATAIASLHEKYEIRTGYGFLTVKHANARPKPY